MRRRRGRGIASLLTALVLGGCASLGDSPSGEDPFALLKEYEKCVRESDDDIRTVRRDPFRCEELRKRLEAMQRQQRVESAGRAAQEHVQRGNEAHAQRRFAEAEAEHSRALQRAPDDAAAANNRGLARGAQGRHAEAIQDFNRAIQNARTPQQRADSLINRGDAQAANGQLREAIESYTEAIRQAPSARAFVNRGNAHAAQGRSREAIADYDEAIRRDPNSAAAYVNRGNAHAEQGRYAEARADYERAIGIRGDRAANAAAYNNRGSINAIQGRGDAARADYDEAERIAPGATPARENRDAVARARPPAAPEPVRPQPTPQPPPPATGVKPPPPPVRDRANELSRRGLEHYDNARYREAIADCEEAARLRPGNSEDHLCAGLAYEALQQSSRAVDHFRRARALDPGLKEAVDGCTRLGGC